MTWKPPLKADYKYPRHRLRLLWNDILCDVQAPQPTLILMSSRCLLIYTIFLFADKEIVGRGVWGSNIWNRLLPHWHWCWCWWETRKLQTIYLVDFILANVGKNYSGLWRAELTYLFWPCLWWKFSVLSFSRITSGGTKQVESMWRQNKLADRYTNMLSKSRTCLFFWNDKHSIGCYHRLIVCNPSDTILLVDAMLKSNSFQILPF